MTGARSKRKEIVMGDPIVEESQAKGSAERAVKESKEVIRFLRCAVDQLHGIVLNLRALFRGWFDDASPSGVAKLR